jgi:hypothetical protein
MVSACVRTLEDEVVTLKGTVRERDKALSGAGQEIEGLRAMVHDRDEALRASEKMCGKLRDEVVGWQTHSEGKLFVMLWPWCRGPRFMLTWAYVPELEKEQQAAQATTTLFLNLFEAEARWTQLFQGAITSVCDGLGVAPDADTEEDASRNSFVHRMVALGRLVRERIRGGLHHGVKRALAIVQSGFMYDMDLITDGFITDPDRTDEENETAYLGLIEAAKEPGSCLAKLFEVEVVLPADDVGL